MMDLLTDIEGIEVHIDDILMHGPDCDRQSAVKLVGGGIF